MSGIDNNAKTIETNDALTSSSQGELKVPILFEVGI